MEKVYSDLDNAAGLDYRLFWKLLRKRKRRPKMTCSKLTINGNDYIDHDVTRGFQEYFTDIFDTHDTQLESEFECSIK